MKPGIIIVSLALSVTGCLVAPHDNAPPQRSAPAIPFERVEGLSEAPLGNTGTASIINYTRVAPYIAVSGRPGLVGVEAAHASGFRTIIDLRQMAEEGTQAEQARARELGLNTVSMPMPGEAENVWPFITGLSALLDDTENYPILLNCGSANRAGAAWALYRIRMGVPEVIAIEEGRGAGMTQREELVKEVFSLKSSFTD